MAARPVLLKDIRFNAAAFARLAVALQMSAIGPKQDMPKNAIGVAIGGKADMGWCTAHVCF